MSDVNSAIATARSKGWTVLSQGVGTNSGGVYTYSATLFLDYSKVTGKSVTLSITWKAVGNYGGTITKSATPSNYMSEITRHPL